MARIDDLLKDTWDIRRQISDEGSKIVDYDSLTGRALTNEDYYNPITGSTPGEDPVQRAKRQKAREGTLLGGLQNGLENILNAAGQGAIGVVSGTSQGIRSAGEGTFAEPLTNFLSGGQEAQDALSKANRMLGSASEFTGHGQDWDADRIVSDPTGYITDSKGLWHDLGNLAGSGLALGAQTAALGAVGSAAGIGGAAGSIGSLAAKLANFADKYKKTKWLAAALRSKAGPLIIGNVINTLPEVFSESGNVAQDLKDQGVTDPGQIRWAMAKNALAQAPLLALSNAAESLGFAAAIGNKIHSKVGKAALGAAGVVANAYREGNEEAMQQAANDWAEGLIKGGYGNFILSAYDPRKWSESQRNQFAGAFMPSLITGGLGAGVGHIVGSAAQAAQNSLDKQEADSSNSGITNEQFLNAIMGQESSGDPNAVNSRTGAQGLFQIMPGNWSSWAQEAGLPADAPKTAENQTIVAKHKLNEYINAYGREGALVAWYSGEQNGQRWKDGKSTWIDDDGNEHPWDYKWRDDEPSVSQYVSKVMGRLGVTAAGPGAGGGGINVLKDAEQWIGQRMPSGPNGCVEAVTRIGAAHNPFLREELDKGVASVSQLVADAGNNVVPFDENNLQEGDIIVYQDPADGTDSHVVMYDGKGGYVGNSSSADEYRGKVVADKDYKKMGGLVPVKIIKTGRGFVGGNGASVSAYDSSMSDYKQRVAYLEDSISRTDDQELQNEIQETLQSKDKNRINSEFEKVRNIFKDADEDSAAILNDVDSEIGAENAAKQEQEKQTISDQQNAVGEPVTADTTGTPATTTATATQEATAITSAKENGQPVNKNAGLVAVTRNMKKFPDTNGYAPKAIQLAAKALGGDEKALATFNRFTDADKRNLTALVEQQAQTAQQKENQATSPVQNPTPVTGDNTQPQPEQRPNTSVSPAVQGQQVGQAQQNPGQQAQNVGQAQQEQATQMPTPAPQQAPQAKEQYKPEGGKTNVRGTENKGQTESQSVEQSGNLNPNAQPQQAVQPKGQSGNRETVQVQGTKLEKNKSRKTGKTGEQNVSAETVPTGGTSAPEVDVSKKENTTTDEELSEEGDELIDDFDRTLDLIDRKVEKLKDIDKDEMNRRLKSILAHAEDLYAKGGLSANEIKDVRESVTEAVQELQNYDPVRLRREKRDITKEYPETKPYVEKIRDIINSLKNKKISVKEAKDKINSVFRQATHDYYTHKLDGSARHALINLDVQITNAFLIHDEPENFKKDAQRHPENYQDVLDMFPEDAKKLGIKPAEGLNEKSKSNAKSEESSPNTNATVKEETTKKKADVDAKQEQHKSDGYTTGTVTLKDGTVRSAVFINKGYKLGSSEFNRLRNLARQNGGEYKNDKKTGKRFFSFPSDARRDAFVEQARKDGITMPEETATATEAKAEQTVPEKQEQTKKQTVKQETQQEQATEEETESEKETTDATTEKVDTTTEKAEEQPKEQPPVASKKEQTEKKEKPKKATKAPFNSTDNVINGIVKNYEEKLITKEQAERELRKHQKQVENRAYEIADFDKADETNDITNAAMDRINGKDTGAYTENKESSKAETSETKESATKETVSDSGEEADLEEIKPYTDKVSQVLDDYKKGDISAIEAEERLNEITDQADSDYVEGADRDALNKVISDAEKEIDSNEEKVAPPISGVEENDQTQPFIDAINETMDAYNSGDMTGDAAASRLSEIQQDLDLVANGQSDEVTAVSDAPSNIDEVDYEDLNNAIDDTVAMIDKAEKEKSATQTAPANGKIEETNEKGASENDNGRTSGVATPVSEGTSKDVLGQSSVQSGESTGSGRSDTGAAQRRGQQRERTDGVSGSGTATSGEKSDTRVQENQSADRTTSTGSSDVRGSSDTSYEGSPSDEQRRNDSIAESVANRRNDEVKAKKQQAQTKKRLSKRISAKMRKLEEKVQGAVASVADEFGNPAFSYVEEIKEKGKKKVKKTVKVAARKLGEILTSGQTEDVARAVTYFKDGNKGIVFTNGTGTGKTYTALGIARKFVNDGKKNILFITPSQNLVSDFIEAANHGFNLDFKALENEKSNNGGGLCATTYKNFGDNRSLKDVNWDLIITDECQEVFKGDKKDATNRLSRLRSLSGHDRGFQMYLEDNHPELADKIRSLSSALKKKNTETNAAKKAWKTNGTSEDWNKYQSLLNEKNQLALQLDSAVDELNKFRPAELAEYEKRSRDTDTKVVFLSATPFAHIENLEMVEGYAFKYSDYGPETGTSENPSGHDKFLIQNFGYKYKGEKLVSPDTETLLKNARAFNRQMVESGALHGRRLVSDYDYDRGYLTVGEKDRLGQLIDEGYTKLTTNSLDTNLIGPVFEHHFNGRMRNQLLEAIKAKAVIPIVKQYLAQGKKVALFYKGNKNNASNPFVLTDEDFKAVYPGTGFDAVMKRNEAKEQYKKFRENPANAKYFNLDLNDLDSPINVLPKAFGNAIGVYNGNTSDAQKKDMVKDFQNDNGHTKIILCQVQAAGAGLSLHDKTGKHQRVAIFLNVPTAPTEAIQCEGRIFRLGNMSNAIFRYLTTGTKMEKVLFGQTVGNRAGLTEALSMGDEGRALADTFRQLYEFAETEEGKKRFAPGNNFEGTGGKALDALSSDDTLTDFEKAKQAYKDRMEGRINSAVDGTPEPLGEKMVEWLFPQNGNRLLEPSAGDGNIARWMPSYTNNYAMEPDDAAFANLSARIGAGTKTLRAEFENLKKTFTAKGIVMNPPASAALSHLQLAYGEHLQDNGRIVAIVPDTKTFDQAFHNWIDVKTKAVKDGEKTKIEIVSGEPSAVIRADIKLPDCVLNKKARLLVIDKYTNKTTRNAAANNTKVGIEITARNNEEFFDKIEDFDDIPERYNQNLKPPKKVEIKTAEDVVKAKKAVSEAVEQAVKDTSAPQYSVRADNGILDSSHPEVQRSVEDLKQEIKEQFAGSEITDDGANRLTIKTNAGNITVDVQNQMIVSADEEARAKEAHGISQDQNVVVEGSYTTGGLDRQGCIMLSQEGRKGTGYHEVFHAAWDLALRTKEKTAMNNHFGKGNFEAMADAYRDWMLKRKEQKGTLFGKLFQKINDFVHKAAAVLTGVENIHNVMRKVESGEVWTRAVDTQDASLRVNDRQTFYSATEKQTGNQEKNPDELAKKLRAIYKNTDWKKGSSNFDIGIGHDQNVTDYLEKEHGVKNTSFDLYNGSAAENKAVMDANAGKNDTVTVAGVLNTIKEPAQRKNVILLAAKALKSDGTATFQIYEGDGSGIGRGNADGTLYQNNMKAADYVAEVQRYFNDVKVEGNTIIAKSPSFDPTVKAVWSMDDLATDDVAFSTREANDKLADSLAKDPNINKEATVHVDRANISVEKLADRVRVERIERKQNRGEEDFGRMSASQKTWRSPSYIAEHFTPFRFVYNLAKTAYHVQEKLRDNFYKGINRINAVYLADKADKQAVNEVLLKGDLEGKEYSTEELKAMGLSDKATRGYHAMRSMIAKAWKLLNESRLKMQVYHKEVNYNQLLEMRRIQEETGQEIGPVMANGKRQKVSYFMDIRSVDVVGYRTKGAKRNTTEYLTEGSKVRAEQRFMVTYRKAKTWERTETMTSGALDDMRKHNEYRIISSEKQDDGYYEVRYEQRAPDVGRIAGYIPHLFHNVFAAVKVDGKNVVIGSRRTIYEAQKICAQYLKDHPEISDTNVMVIPKTFNPQNNEGMRAIEVGDMQYFKLMGNLEKSCEMTSAEAQEFLRDKVSRTPRNRFLGNLQQRMGAQGWERDLDWVLPHYFNSVARYVALNDFKSKSITWFEKNYGEFTKDYGSFNEASYIKTYIRDVNGSPNFLESLLTNAVKDSEYLKVAQHILSKIPGVTWLVKKAGMSDRPLIAFGNGVTQIMAVAKLGFANVSSALLNLGQIINAYGIVADEGAIAKAMKDAAIAPGKSTVADREKRIRLARIFAKSGINEDINLTASGGGYTKLRGAGNLMKGLTLFNTMDMYSRRVAVLAGYYHAKKLGMSDSRAIEYAQSVNRKANFDNSVVDSAAAFRMIGGSGIGNIMIQFKKYGAKEMELMYDITAHGTLPQKLKFWGSYLLFAGLFQLPLFDAVADLIAGFTGTDPRLKLKKAIMEAAGDSPIGRGLAKVAMYGVLAPTVGVDVSQRVGIGDAVPSMSTAIYNIVGGPTASTIVQLVDAFHHGNVNTQLRAFSPALGNYADAIAGSTYDSKGRIKRNLTPSERVVKAIGFRNTDESVDSDISRIRYQDKQEQKSEKEKFIDELLEKEDDGEPRDEDDIKKMKELGITKKTLKNARKTRDMTADERAKARGGKKANKKLKNDPLEKFRAD